MTKNKRLQNEININSSKYRKKSNFVIGDWVLLKNRHKTSKFHPIFEQQPYRITNIDEKANKIIVQRNDTILCRHPDDLKPYFGTYTDVDEHDVVDDQRSRDIYEDDDFDLDISLTNTGVRDSTNQQELRRSNRNRVQNSRYFNSEFVS